MVVVVVLVGEVGSSKRVLLLDYCCCCCRGVQGGVGGAGMGFLLVGLIFFLKSRGGEKWKFQ